MQVRTLLEGHVLAEGPQGLERVNTALVGDCVPGEWVLVFLGSARERRRGYLAALAAHGIAADERLLAEVGEDLCQRGASAVGYRLFGYQPMQRLLHGVNRMVPAPLVQDSSWREALSISPMARSATSSLSTLGVCVTIAPRALAATTSMPS